jgi:hypothetical protein
MHAYKMHAYMIHTNEIHAYEMHTYEMHTHEVHAHGQGIGLCYPPLPLTPILDLLSSCQYCWRCRYGRLC